MSDRSTQIIERYEALYHARRFKKKFIPIEEIAKNPAFHGYKFDAIESNVDQQGFINSKKKIIAAIAANRSGKTEAGAIKTLNICHSSKTKGRFWVLAETFDLQREGPQEKILEYLKPERIIKKEYLKGETLKSISIINDYDKIIRIEFKTYEQGAKKLQTAKLIGAWLDEEPPEDIYDEVRTRTADLSGQVILTFTPLSGLTWSYEAIYCEPNEFTKVYKWGMADNPFIPRIEIEILKRTFSKRKANMRLYGLYQGSETMIYEDFDRDIHIRDNLYDEELPVTVCIDWGVNVTSVGFYQQKTVQVKKRMIKEHYLIDCVEYSDMSYSKVMNAIIKRGYMIHCWYCDPAARGRSQATKSGTSLLALITEEYSITFRYITSLGVEESIDITASYLINAAEEVRLYFQKGIKLNNDGDSPEMRIEKYIRDDKGVPIKDGVNDHFCDQLRYYIANEHRETTRQWKQH